MRRNHSPSAGATFLLHRPTPGELDACLEASQGLPLSFEPNRLPKRSQGFVRVDRGVANIGRGETAFARAGAALAGWAHFDVGWIEIFPARTQIVVGAAVVVAVSHLGFWSLNGCRILSASLSDPETDDSQREYRFTYGTLTNHAECGEEAFAVRIDRHTGAVTYHVRATSSPRAALAWLGWPIARRLQSRFRHDSAKAMARAIGSQGI